jgi:hypothetical protein
VIYLDVGTISLHYFVLRKSHSYYHCVILVNCDAAIDAPGGFLFEWWSVFWDIFIARTNEKHSEVAAAYLEVAWNCFFEKQIMELLHLPRIYCDFDRTDCISVGDIGTANKSERAPAADADAAVATHAAKTCSAPAS